MEPDDQSLHHLLDTTPPAGPDDLRTIVAKAGRHRVRFAALAVGAALLVGGGAGGAIGYASSNHANHVVQTANAPGAGNSPTAGSAASGASGSTSLSPAGIPGTIGSVALTHVFTRTANGVEIRAYETPSLNLPPEAARCGINTGPRVEAEVSTDKAVGVASGGFEATSGAGAVKNLSGNVFGTAEGAPIGVVLASTTSSVTSVKVTFVGGATDQMVPSGGWVALAGPVPASWGKSASRYTDRIGTLSAYNATGTKVFSQAFSFGFSSFGTVQPQPAPCETCGGPILHPTPASSPPNVVSPGLPTNKNSSGAATGSGFACPAIQGSVGGGSASSGAATNG